MHEEPYYVVRFTSRFALGGAVCGLPEHRAWSGRRTPNGTLVQPDRKLVRLDAEARQEAREAGKAVENAGDRVAQETT